MATGTATSDGYVDGHWIKEREEQGDIANYVKVKWDTILDTETEDLLSTEECHVEGVKPVNWKTMVSGISIPPEVAELMEDLWSKHIKAIRPSFTNLPTGVIDSENEEFPEGRELFIRHRSYERNPRLVEMAKTNAMDTCGRLACIVCEFDFAAAYGSVGEGFIECHHIVPISELGEHGSTRLCDVVLVCSNCHRMLHRKRPWLTIDELQTLLATKQ